jgi:hypothetical protein
MKFKIFIREEHKALARSRSTSSGLSAVLRGLREKNEVREDTIFIL